MKLNEILIDYDLIKQFDEVLLHQYQCIPVKQDEFYTYFYIANECNIDGVFNVISKQTLCSINEINFFLNDLNSRIKLYELANQSIQLSTNQNSINDFLMVLLTFAIKKRSSDIHIETSSEYLIIRLRIDGVLKHFFTFNKKLYPIVSSIIKLQCTLDMTQMRKPLNGRFSKRIENKSIDFRVSTMPTILGESIVLRILEDEFEYHSLQDLGFSKYQYRTMLQSLSQTQGLIIVTGPTGSGKSTTLYSMLQQLNTEEKKIITVEDPIEYQIKGIQQIAVNEALELGFETVLKNILRQDPDIIMVGEIRDESSLQIALQAALTGHLVLTTLHTNDAVSTLYRLFDLGAKAYIIASALKMIIAQRLVLKRCECENGCSKCNFSGFKGRLCISEVLNINEKLAEMIIKQRAKCDIENYLVEEGFISMYKDAQDKIKEQLTTKEEVIKVLGLIDEYL